MTTHRVVFGAFLMLGVLVAPSAVAQSSVPVRSIDDVSTLERWGMAVRRALIPGSRVFAPLYAYDHNLACDNGNNPPEELVEYNGPAAIVAEENGATVAYYHRSVDDALAAVRQGDWCNRENSWHLATTLPLDGDFTEQGRYLSRDVGRIETLLQRPPE